MAKWSLATFKNWAANMSTPIDHPIAEVSEYDSKAGELLTKYAEADVALMNYLKSRLDKKS